MAVTTTKTNKPINPRGNDQSPKGYNRAALYSGKALSFDGVNDEVNCGDINVAFSEISFAFHFNADSFSNNCIFQKESVFRFIGVNTNQIDIVLATTGNSWYSKKMTLTNLESKDYFLVTTYNGSELKAYLNGVLVDTLGGYNGSVASVSQNVYVGRTNAGLYYNGKVSGVKVYSTALTAAQVLDLYNNPEKIVPTGVSNTALKLWLPMMEGAGTTAYDGSGNGNHGTISGATWTHGVGAPVAQTAVIDWNKGTNLIAYSTALQGNWILSGGTWTSGQDDPIGGTNAYKITATNNDPYLIQNATSGISGTQYTAKCWVKGDAGREARLWVIRDNAEFRYEDFTLTGNWQEIETTPTAFGTTPVSFVSFRLDAPNDTPVAGDVSYIFAPRLVDGDNADVYVPTLSTAQTSPVLLPQGLTSGRDITGVNLFENVRKQYALNLDGQSWAEIHDNESLDFGTGSFSLEAWVKAAYIDTGSSYNVILNLGNTLGGSAGLTSRSGYIAFFYGTSSLNYSTSNDGSWVHIVGTYDGTNTTIYANGVEESQTARTAINVSTDETKYIGKDSNITRIYKDQIAQPRIYNRALTADEVEQNYNAGKNTYS